MKHTENNYIKSLKSSQWFLYARIGTVSYVKNTGKPVRRVFDHIGQRLFFVQRRTSVEMIYFDESLDSSAGNRPLWGQSKPPAKPVVVI